MKPIKLTFKLIVYLLVILGGLYGVNIGLELMTEPSSILNVVGLILSILSAGTTFWLLKLLLKRRKNEKVK